MISRLGDSFMLSKMPMKREYDELIENIKQLPKEQILVFLAGIKRYFYEDETINYKFFRRAFLEDDASGTIETRSAPLECMTEAISHELRKAYCHMKFNQIYAYIQESKE